MTAPLSLPDELRTEDDDLVPCRRCGSDADPEMEINGLVLCDDCFDLELAKEARDA